MWDRHHNVARGGGGGPAKGPVRELYTDNDPATTIKGCGFKDADAATTTLRLAQQPGSRYKTYWTVRAMRERAARHPHRSAGMDAAVEVFDRWLAARARGVVDPDAAAAAGPEELEAERAQRAELAESFANAHARRNCGNDAEFALWAKRDKADALVAVREAAGRYRGGGRLAAPGPWFRFGATAFVAMFGGPGEHGYGSHGCAQAAAAGLARFRCTCQYRGTHRVEVTPAGRAQLQLGKRFPFSQWALEWSGAPEERARFVSASAPAAGKGQLSMARFLKRKADPPAGAGDREGAKR